MCVYSMVTDHYIDRWTPRVPGGGTTTTPYVPGNVPGGCGGGPTGTPNWMIPPQQPLVTQAELDEFRALLDRAREYDRKNNEPLCELEEKKETLRRLAKQLGVEIDFL